LIQGVVGVGTAGAGQAGAGGHFFGQLVGQGRFAGVEDLDGGDALQADDRIAGGLGHRAVERMGGHQDTVQLLDRLEQ